MPSRNSERSRDRDRDDDRDDDRGRGSRDRDRGGRDRDDDRGSDRRSGKSGGFGYRGRTDEDVARRSKQSSGRYDSYLTEDVTWFKPRDGENCIRIMPWLSTNDPKFEEYDEKWGNHWGIDIILHRNVGADKGTYLCTAKTGDGVCPICDVYHKDNEKDLKGSDRVLVWLIDRDDEKAGPKLWAMPLGTSRDISAASKSRSGGGSLQIDDPNDGYDVYFEKSGEKKRTKYTRIEPSRDSSPLHENDGKMDKWLDYIADRRLPDLLKYYDAEYLDKVLAGQVSGSGDDEEDEDGDDRGSRRGGGRGRRGDDDDDSDSRSSRSSRRGRGGDDDDDGRSSRRSGRDRGGDDDGEERSSRRGGGRGRDDDGSDDADDDRGSRRGGRDEERSSRRDRDDDDGDSRSSRRGGTRSRDDDDRGGRSRSRGRDEGDGDDDAPFERGGRGSRGRDDDKEGGEDAPEPEEKTSRRRGASDKGGEKDALKGGGGVARRRSNPDPEPEESGGDDKGADDEVSSAKERLGRVGRRRG